MSTAQASASPRRFGMRSRVTRDRQERITGYLFMVPAAIYLAIFFGYPIVKNVLMGFQNYTVSTFFTGKAPFVGFDNYAEAFQSPVFSTAVRNTIIFTIASLVFQFAIGLALANFFRRHFPLNNLVRALLMVPWLLPMLAGAAVWQNILDQDSGILNQTLMTIRLIGDPIPWLTSPSMALTALVIVNVWIGIPFNMVLLYSGMQSIPEDVYEAAALDGAGKWKSFWYITFPLLRPVSLVVLLLGVVYTVKAIDLVLALTGGGPAESTETLASMSYHYSFTSFEFGPGAAVGNVLIVVSLIFALLYLRSTRRQDQS